MCPEQHCKATILQFKMGPKETFRGDPYVHCHHSGHDIEYTYVKTYKNVHFKNMQFNISQ